MSRVAAIPGLDGVLAISIGQPSNDNRHAYAVTGRDGIDLIDVCGPRVAFSMLALKEFGVDIHNVRSIVATHGHQQQVGGYLAFRKQFGDCSLRLHRNDWVQLMTGDPRLLEHDTDEWLPAVSQAWLEPLEEGMAMTLGNHRATIWHTPGHTRGSVCLIATINGIRVVFSGDTLFGPISSWNPFPSMLDLTASVGRLIDEPFDVFLPTWGMGEQLPKPKAMLVQKYRYLGRMLNPWAAESQRV